MRFLLLGKNGQLGWELHRCLGPLGEIVAVDYPEIDLTDLDHLRRVVVETGPQVIVNATAYTAVDRAESEPDLARRINAEAPGLLAEEACKTGAALVHYSTDYVFDGRKGAPYTEEDAPVPLGEYGRSKLEGEQAVAALGGAFLVLRTAWVYSLRRPSFVTKLLEWSRRQTELRVVTDQVSNPTWARSLAEATALLLARAGDDPAGWLRERKGLYHLAGWGYASRMQWAQAVLEAAPHPEQRTVRELQPAVTADFPSPADRPLFSALDCSLFEAVFRLRLPDWEESLRLALEKDG